MSARVGSYEPGDSKIGGYSIGYVERGEDGIGNHMFAFAFKTLI